MNLLPIGLMSAAWMAPLTIFWLQVCGPLNASAADPAQFAPPLAAFGLGAAFCFAMAWLPPGYYRPRRFERSGRLYEALGIRLFRQVVPDGDLFRLWKKRSEPNYRLLASRGTARKFLLRTELSERRHLVLLAVGTLSAAHAFIVDWQGWAAYLSLSNLLANAFPIMLQRYTRNRIQNVLAGGTLRTLK